MNLVFIVKSAFDDNQVVGALYKMTMFMFNISSMRLTVRSDRLMFVFKLF